MPSFNSFTVLFISLLISCVSCVRDTDFEQARDIELTPVVELDLVYFDINASQFFDVGANAPILTVRDTTALEFIQGQDIREVLQRAEFFFKFENEIPRNFLVAFDFLSESNEIQYSTQTAVIQGTTAQVQTTIFEPIVEGEEIDQLTRANKVVVHVTIPSSSAALSGNLNLQSKVVYFLEID